MTQRQRAKKKCLIVYHFFAHYRLHLIRELMMSDEWEFEMVSAPGTTAGIKGIDPELAALPLDENGLCWTFVKNNNVLGSRLPFLWQKGLLKRLDTTDYDAVIFLGSIYFLSTWLAMPKVRRLGKKVIIWTHGFLGKDNPVTTYIRHLFYGQADQCLLYGERSREIMLKSGFYHPGTLHVIYNSLDYTAMERSRKLLKDSDKKDIRQSIFNVCNVPVIVTIGRINRVKRIDLLLKALYQLKNKNYQFKCLIIGDGEEMSTLKSLSNHLKLDEDIVFYGRAYGDEADKLLLISDLCVVPGDIGLTAMHAMSAGLPVITHNRFKKQMPEHEAIIEGITGTFYEYGSIIDLARSIKQWLQLDHNKKKMTRVACLGMINDRYNCKFQAKVINTILQ